MSRSKVRLRTNSVPYEAGKAAAAEHKAGTAGDLDTTVSDQKEAEHSLATTTASCGQVSADHESTVVSSADELKALAQAYEISMSTTSGAVGQFYSFLQGCANSGLRIRTRVGSARSEVLMLIKNHAQQQHFAALAQLASTHRGRGPLLSGRLRRSVCQSEGACQ